MARDSHDHFVKHWLAHPDAARELRTLLPPALANAIDWSRLVEDGTVTVDAHGVELRSDVVLSMRTLDRTPLLLHLHVEHQRTVERWMPLRVLEYQARLWRRWTRQEGVTSLPAIASIVLFNGVTRWTQSTALQELVPSHQVNRLGALQTRCNFQLVDVRDVSETEAFSPGFRLGLQLLQAADDADLWGRLASWGTLLHAVAELPGGLERLLGAFTYASRLAGAPSDATIRAIRAHLPRDIQEDMMTWEQSIEARGEARGRVTALRESLQAVLDARFGPLTEATTKRIEQAELSQLQAWLVRFAQGVDALDELFQVE
ncbi:MAG: Rpn family recombination-promoting nuclease/putative transposase [Myxococcota bacterium]